MRESRPSLRIPAKAHGFRTAMTISKAGQPIRSLEDWYRLAPPKSPDQWVPGRTAQELARAWLGEQLPPEVAALFRGHSDFGPITTWAAEPEVRLRFDDYRGEPRNGDLVVDAQDRLGPFLIAVEGKADEPFGDTVAGTLAAAASGCSLTHVQTVLPAWNA